MNCNVPWGLALATSRSCKVTSWMTSFRLCTSPLGNGTYSSASRSNSVANASLLPRRFTAPELASKGKKYIFKFYLIKIGVILDLTLAALKNQISRTICFVMHKQSTECWVIVVQLHEIFCFIILETRISWNCTIGGKFPKKKRTYHIS